MATPNAEAKPNVGNGPQGKPEGNQGHQGQGHQNNFHSGSGGRGGRGGGRRFSGPNNRGPRNNMPQQDGNTPNRGGPQQQQSQQPQQSNKLGTYTPSKPPVNQDSRPIKKEDDTPNRGQGQGMGMRRGGSFRGGPGRDDRPRGEQERLNEKLAAVSGPSHDLPPLELSEKKFSGRNRLYIGNLTNDVTEEEVQKLFEKFGETSELFVNKEKNFAFIRVDFKVNAEKAKRELDGYMRKGRPLKVRFAPNSTAVKVKNLTPYVTNELLEKAFSVFGDIERAIVIADERGKSTGEGIVEFARKPGAQLALRRCTEGSYFVTSSLRPVILEPMEQIDDIDGYSEKCVPKKNPDYIKAREVGPRFATPGSFEYEYGTRWKQLFERRKQKEEALQREMKLEEEKLEAQMEYAKYEHETEMLRDQLRQRELDRERQKRDWENKERNAEEYRRMNEDMMRRQQEDMSLRMHHQDEEMRRRQQENSLFMQAHQLSSLLDQQEQDLGGPQRGSYDPAPGGPQRGSYDPAPVNDVPLRDARDYETPSGSGPVPPDPKAFMDAYDRGGRYDSPRGDMMDDMANGAGRGMNNQRSRWGPPERARVDDYPNKRRRF